MAILKLEPNKPRQIALRFREPKEVNGRKGREFQYSLQGGYTLYLPPIAADEIRSLNLEPGESFTILQSVGEGNAIKYEVERVPQPKPMGQARTIDSARPDLTTPQSQHLFKQLVATIEAVKAAEAFAVSIDRPVKFTEADIRAMAISGFIEHNRRAA